MENRELMYLAENAKQKSYSPYSKFKVGAALLTKDGKIYVADVVKLFLSGEKEFEKIAISGSSDDFCFPCGACRQVMSEFCGKDFVIILENGKEIKSFTLGELLPYSFKLDK